MTGAVRTVSKRRNLIWVAIYVVVGILLATAILYFTVGERQGERGWHGPILPQHIDGGVRLVMPFEEDQELMWGDLEIELSDGTNTTSWTNLTAADLTSSHGNVTWHFGSPKSLGGLEVWLNVTDSKGDGLLDHGDYMDLTTGGPRFSSEVGYVLTLLYMPTQGSLLSMTFFV